jgi:hypothetical protein
MIAMNADYWIISVTPDDRAGWEPFAVDAGIAYWRRPADPEDRGLVAVEVLDEDGVVKLDACGTPLREYVTAEIAAAKAVK